MCTTRAEDLGVREYFPGERGKDRDRERRMSKRGELGCGGVCTHPGWGEGSVCGVSTAEQQEGAWEEPDSLYLELSDCNSEILLGVAVSASERGQSKAS